MSLSPKNQRYHDLIHKFFTDTWYANPEEVKVYLEEGSVPSLDTWRVREEINFDDGPEITNQEDIHYDVKRLLDGAFLEMEFSEPATKHLAYWLLEANTTDIEDLIVYAAMNVMKG